LGKKRADENRVAELEQKIGQQVRQEVTANNLAMERLRELAG
jgi:hypothetical protein